MNVGLTAEEDAELRRLAALARYGRLVEERTKVLVALRQRDRRDSVREPDDVVAPLIPRQADGPRARD